MRVGGGQEQAAVHSAQRSTALGSSAGGGEQAVVLGMSDLQSDSEDEEVFGADHLTSPLRSKV